MNTSLIAVGEGKIWVEETNQTFPLSDLPGVIMSERIGPGFIVGHKISRYLARAWNGWHGPDWTLRAKTPRPPVWPWPAEYVEGYPHITRIGLKRHRRLGVRAYEVIDTHLYARATRDIVTLDQIVEWYGGLRHVLWGLGVDIRPTLGGTAKQILDANTTSASMLGKGTQEKARLALAPALVGHGSAIMGQNYPQAWYLDQIASWPRCARSLGVPVDPQVIDLPETHTKEGVAERLTIPGVHRVAFNNAPSEHRWISSEHHRLREVGYWFEGIGNKHVWPMLNPLSETTLTLRDQRAEHPVLSETIKTLTVATFGLLGMESRPQASTSWGTGTSATKLYSCFGEDIHLHTSVRTWNAKGNAIALAMLRDRMHTRTWELARSLATFGLKVLSLYDDGLIVAGGQLMPLPATWAVKHELTDLIFWDSSNWIAGSTARLPNYPRNAREEIYRQYEGLVLEARGGPTKLPVGQGY